MCLREISGLPSSRSANSDTEFASFSAGDPATSNGRRFRRSLRPTSEQLVGLKRPLSLCVSVTHHQQENMKCCDATSRFVHVVKRRDVSL